MNFLDFIGFIITFVAMFFLFLRRSKEKKVEKVELIVEEKSLPEQVRAQKPAAKTYANYGKNSNDDIPKRKRKIYVKLDPRQMVISKEILGKPKGL